MKIGFTGTQQGMNDKQVVTFVKLLRGIIDKASIAAPLQNAKVEFHHGDCIGADENAHALYEGISVAAVIDPKIVSHPPINQSKRAFTIADEERAPKEYLERNHDIVDECDILIACPKGFAEEKRSGTWATIRYAIKSKKPVIIILPSGEVSER